VKKKQPIPDFQVSTISQGKTVALNRWGGKSETTIQWPTYGVISAPKNFDNLKIHVQVIVKDLVTCIFLRHHVEQNEVTEGT